MRKLILALLLFGLSVAGAAFSFAKMSGLRSEASWLLARADAYGLDYGVSLEGSFADAQLTTFEQRRGLLEQAHRWQRLEIACIVIAAGAGTFAYALYLVRRARHYTLRDGMLHR